MPITEAQRPTWAEISLSALRGNLHGLSRRARAVNPASSIAAVVKCDAYGHGAAQCALALAETGVPWFAVTSPAEGIALRDAGVTQRILLLSGFYRDEAGAVVDHGLTPSLWENEHLEYLSRALAQRDRSGTPFPVHIEVDTGMSRQGVPAGRFLKFVESLRRHPEIEVEAIYQHYADSEVVDSPHAAAQDAQFLAALENAVAAGVRPRYFHRANSAGLATRPGSFLTELFRSKEWHPQELFRCGISLYGYCLPFEGGDGPIEELAISPVLGWKTRIISVREVPRDTRIGYSGTYTTTRASRIASLAVGYGDGLDRALSNRERVLVRGRFAPMVGNISMDMTLIDVTDIDGADIGDEVVILGAQGEHRIDAWEHAKIIGTIPYEVLCNISKRVPRVYIE